MHSKTDILLYNINFNNNNKVLFESAKHQQSLWFMCWTIDHFLYTVNRIAHINVHSAQYQLRTRQSNWPSNSCGVYSQASICITSSRRSHVAHRHSYARLMATELNPNFTLSSSPLSCTYVRSNPNHNEKGQRAPPHLVRSMVALLYDISLATREFM